MYFKITELIIPSPKRVLGKIDDMGFNRKLNIYIIKIPSNRPKIIPPILFKPLSMGVFNKNENSSKKIEIIIFASQKTNIMEKKLIIKFTNPLDIILGIKSEFILDLE